MQAPESFGANHLLHQGDPPNAPVFVSGPKKVLGNNGNQRGSGPIQGRPNVNPQDCVLPSIEPPLSPKNNTLDNGTLDHIAGRMSGGCSIRSLTPRRLPYKDIQRPLLEDRAQDQLPKRRRVAYYEPINADRSLPHIARTSNPADALTGERYMALGYPPRKSPTQGDIRTRKRYLAQFDPIPQSESKLGKVQVSSLSATHLDLQSGTLFQEDYEPAGRQSLPRNKSHETRRQWRSQGQPRPLPEGGITFPTTHCSDRAVPGRSSNFSEQTNFHQDHCTNESTRPFNVSESHKSTRGHTNDHALMALGNTQWRRHYADDFVRTIDSQVPIPMEYPAQHHLYRDHAPEPLTQQAYVQLPHHPSYNTTVPGNISSKQPPIRDSPHSPVTSAAQCYATMVHSGIRYHDAGLVESAYTVRPFKDSHNFPRYGFDYSSLFVQSYPCVSFFSQIVHHSFDAAGTLTNLSCRQICEQQPHKRYTSELGRPIDVRRGGRPQPCHSVPEGRTVVIVD